MDTVYDICIFGAGPAGLAAAVEACEFGKVLVLELGRPYSERTTCPVIDNGVQSCTGCGGKCKIITGYGGAFTGRSGGTLSPYPAGSHLAHYFSSIDELRAGYDYAIAFWQRFLVGEMTKEGSTDPEEISRFASKVAAQGGVYKHWVGYKMNRSSLAATTLNIAQYLASKVEIKTGVEVVNLATENHIWNITAKNGEVFQAKAVIVATGRKGNSEMSRILDSAGVQLTKTGIDIGIRLEINSNIIDDLADLHPDIKIKFNIFEEEVRTFCFCPKGWLIHFNQDQISRLDDGAHPVRLDFMEGYIDSERPSGRTNMSFLHRLSFRNASEVWEFQREFENRHAELGGLVIAQRYTDIGRKTFSPLPSSSTLTGYRIGSVADVIPEHTCFILFEAMRRFEAVTGKRFLDKEAVLVAPELGNFWPEVRVNNNFMTNVPGLFVAGDTLGFTRGALQATLTGTQAARGAISFLRL